MLKLKLLYFGHQMRRTDSLENIPWCCERLKIGAKCDDRGLWLNGMTNMIDMSLSMFWELVMDREAWRAADLGVVISFTWLSTEINCIGIKAPTTQCKWVSRVDFYFSGISNSLWCSPKNAGFLCLLWNASKSSPLLNYNTCKTKIYSLNSFKFTVKKASDLPVFLQMWNVKGAHWRA